MFPIKDTIPHIGFPAVTWALIALNGIIFIFEISIPPDLLQQLLFFFGLVPARYSYPDWALVHGLRVDYLPFLTSMFLHGGLLHILGNMWFLHIFGSSVEDRVGHLRFLIFYLLSGICANVFYFLVAIHSKVPELGASGAIAGVMGAYVVMFPKARIVTMFLIVFFPVFVEISVFFYVGFWFLMQILSGALSLGSGEAGGVAWWAHIGGFIAGILLLPFFRNSRYPRRKVYPDEIHHLIGR